MNKEELEKRVKQVQDEAVHKQGKNVILNKDKSDTRMTHRTDFLYSVIALAEFDTSSKLMGHTKRFRIISGENLKQYQKGLVKISIKDKEGNPVEAIVHGDVLIIAIKQVLDPQRLAEEVKKKKNNIVSPSEL